MGRHVGRSRVPCLFVDQRTLNELAGELRQALEQLGVPVAITTGTIRADGPGELFVTFDGVVMTIAVITRADLRPAQAKDLPAVGGPDEPATGMVFADRLAENTREILRARGWGWLDRRRGHLRLWCPGARIDTTVTPSGPPESISRVANPFSPKGRELALWLLLHPGQPASPRAISREIDITAGQVTNLLQALTADALLRRDKTPLVPELFWALVEHWKPKRHALAAMPSFAELAAAPEMQAKRWVISDTRAASIFGAPVAVAPGYPPDLYVPDQKALSWLLNRSTMAPDFNQRVATVAIAPTALVCEARFRRRDPGEQWPLAHPVVVALDLAVDRNRGREVVEQWDPDVSLGITRVW